MSDMVRFCVCSAGGKRTALASRERAILSPISHGNAVHTVLSPGDLGGGHDSSPQRGQLLMRLSVCNSGEPAGSPMSPGVREKAAELLCVSHSAGSATLAGSRANFLLTPLGGFRSFRVKVDIWPSSIIFILFSIAIFLKFIPPQHLVPVVQGDTLQTWL